MLFLLFYYKLLSIVLSDLGFRILFSRYASSCGIIIISKTYYSKMTGSLAIGLFGSLPFDESLLMVRLIASLPFPAVSCRFQGNTEIEHKLYKITIVLQKIFG